MQDVKHAFILMYISNKFPIQMDLIGVISISMLITISCICIVLLKIIISGSYVAPYFNSYIPSIRTSYFIITKFFHRY